MLHRVVEIPEQECECGAASDSAHFTRACIYRIVEGRRTDLACTFDGYLCANCGRVWTGAGPDHYGPAPVGVECVEECDGGRDPWTLH